MWGQEEGGNSMRILLWYLRFEPDFWACLDKFSHAAESQKITMFNINLLFSLPLKLEDGPRVWRAFVTAGGLPVLSALLHYRSKVWLRVYTCLCFRAACADHGVSCSTI